MQNKDLVVPLIENGADVDTPFKDVRKNPMNFVSVFMISKLYCMFIVIYCTMLC